MNSLDNKRHFIITLFSYCIRPRIRFSIYSSNFCYFAPDAIDLRFVNPFERKVIVFLKIDQQASINLPKRVLYTGPSFILSLFLLGCVCVCLFTNSMSQLIHVIICQSLLIRWKNTCFCYTNHTKWLVESDDLLSLTSKFQYTYDVYACYTVQICYIMQRLFRRK